MRWSALFVSLLAVMPENYVRVESPADGRTYTLDLDATAVQRALRPVTDAAVVPKLPKWLYPGPDFKPSRLKWDPITGIISGAFLVGGTVDQISAYYDQTLRSQGLRVSSLPYRGSAGLQMTGAGNTATVTVQIQPQPGSIQAIATYAPRNSPHQHFDAVSYDDRAGLLRVRDAQGGEYQLDKASIVSNNLNRPGGVASEGAATPAWLPQYPGAVASPKGRIKWMFKPTAEFVTGDSIRKVYEFYLAQLQSAGATMKILRHQSFRHAVERLRRIHDRRERRRPGGDSDR
jgi:hypothetical protein